MHGIAWSWNKTVMLATANDHDTGDFEPNMVIPRVARRHIQGWTLFFFAFFAAMSLASFTLLEQLGFAAILAVIYGLSSVNQSQAKQPTPCREIFLFGPRADALWYRVLAVGDWMAVLVGLVFTVELIAQLIK
jgi:hypothetical protein